VVGVLATPATFQGELYASVVERFADNVTLLQSTCTGLVQQIERGALDTKKTRAILESALNPMLDQGIDTVVLGCTHYPFVIPVIQEIVGPGVRVIDPAPAVARQVARMLDLHGIKAKREHSDLPLAYTSGKLLPFKSLLPKLIDLECKVQKVRWEEGKILK
jgi:glutamate racemase